MRRDHGGHRLAAHTCRGFLLIAGKSHNITSEKTDAGRRYRIAGK
jgi:hypothetical protein